MATKKKGKGSKAPDRMMRFADEYAIDLNATSAAVRAGYSAKTAKQAGAKCLADERVQARIKELLEARSKRTEITQDRVLKRLAKIAFADLTDVVSWTHDIINDGMGGDRPILKLHIKDSDKLSASARAGLLEVSETIEMNGNRTHKVKMRDGGSALSILAKHVGIGVTKVEVTGKNGKPIKTEAKVVAGRELIDLIKREVLGVGSKAKA